MTYALIFNGSNQQGTSPSNSASLNLTNNFDITLTFSLPNISQLSKYFFTKGANSYGIIFGYVSKTVEFYSASDTNSAMRNLSGIVINDNSTHTVRYVYSNGVFSSYLDGVLQHSGSVSVTLTTNTSPLYIGSAGGSGYINATFNALKIINNGVVEADWEFQEGSGSTVSDSSGNANTITLVNSPTWVTNSVANLGSASLSASGNMTVSGKQGYTDSSNLSASANMTVTPDIDYQGSANLSSNGNLSANGLITQQASATLSASTDMSATLTQTGQAQLGSATLSASASVTADSIVGGQVNGSANLSSTVDMQTNVIQMFNAQVVLSATSSLSAIGDKEIEANANLSSDSSLLANGSLELNATIIISASGTMTLLNVKPIEEGISIKGMRKLLEELKGGIPLVDGQNISIIAGNSLLITATLTEMDGSPIDLEGVTQVRWGFGDSSTGLRKDTNSGISIADAQNGVITIQLNPEDTLGRKGTSKHEMTITDSKGNVSSVLRGYIGIQANIV